MPKWFSEKEKEIISKRLLEQGYKQFSAYGFKKTNIEQIAIGAGISKGAFYSFYESKEMLFMDVIEQVEKNVRKKILEGIDMPGPSPRDRLLNILKGTFGLFKEIPMIKYFTGTDFEFIFRTVPPEKFQEHISSDSEFFEEVVKHCQAAGIPIRVKADQIVGLLYPLVIAFLSDMESDRMNFFASIDMNLELIAAYCLGEVELITQNEIRKTEIAKVGAKE
jgi:AcrR family transcriptional regulator